MGTMTFEKVLQPALETAEQGFPLPRIARARDGVAQAVEIPTSVKLYSPPGAPWKEGDIFKNPDAGHTLRRLIEAEKGAAAKGRHEALRRPADRFYKGDIAKEMAAFSEANGGLFR